MRRFIERLRKLERRTVPSAGALPTIIIVPADGPDRAAALERIEALRKQGREVFTVGEGDDALETLVEAFAP